MHPNNSVDQREVRIELVDGLEFEGERVKDASQFQEMQLDDCGVTVLTDSV